MVDKPELNAAEQSNNVLKTLPEDMRRVTHIPKKLADALGLFASNGWYVDASFPLPLSWRLSQMYEDGEAREADLQMCSYFEERIEQLKLKLCDQHTTRCGVLGAAFRAHQAGEFYLSTPIFLIQSDGIAKDLIGKQLYKRGGMF